MKRLAALLCLSLAACGNLSAETSKPAARVAVETAATDVLTALAGRDFKTLAAFVAEEGLAVSPYVMVDGDDVRLSRAEVERCASNPQTRLWGYRDGSGNPIETTCRRYFDEFVWNADYRKADEVLYDEPRQRGNQVNNNHDFVPGSIVVELHILGQGAQAAMNWKSLRLIFREGRKGLTLIAITRDVWTI
ncbi:hypothetical protein [Microvirga sp. P5_D2]